MPFNFRQDIWGIFGSVTPEEIEEYKAELIRRFEESPEGKAYLKRNDVEEIIWSEAFTDFSIDYLRRPLWMLVTSDVRDILYDIFPEKIIVNPDEAPQIVDELRAFWEYIKREYQEDNAEKILKVFNEKNIVKRLTKELGDETKYSIAKTIMMPAFEDDVDLSDESAMLSYVQDYNAKIQAELDAPLPEKTQKKLDAILKLIKTTCDKHLNSEYTELALEIAEIIANIKPESPINSGHAKSWAAGIVYALGQVNFLFDKSFEPYFSAEDLSKLFNVSQQTASGKAKVVRDRLDMFSFHPEWTVASQQEKNPLTWFLTVNGMPVDIRFMPREAQVEAYNMGLIPYIPADKEQSEDE